MKRLLLLIAVLICSLCSVASANAAVLFGDQTVEGFTDSNATGIAQAWSSTSATSGSGTAIVFYTATAQTGGTAKFGLYANNNGQPSTLLGSGQTTTPKHGGWNTITIPSVSILAGRTYWIAVLGTTSGQTVFFKDRHPGTGPCTTVTSPSGWTSLHTTWSTATTVQNDYCPASAYVTGTVSTGNPPVNSSPPTVSGTAQQGQTLTASNGTWTGDTPITYTYQWQDDGTSNIAGATSSTYVAQASDVGHTLDVNVTANNAAGSSSAASAQTAIVTASGGGGGCDLNATPANFASQVSAATAGQTICLASGSYGTWTGTNKAITVKADVGATLTMTDNFGSTAGNFTLDGISGMGGGINGSNSITIRNSTFSSEQDVQGGSTGIVFDNDHFPAFVGTARVWSGVGNNTVTVSHSTFDNPTQLQGGADGVRCDDGTTTILDNDFSGVRDRDDGTGNHGDPIQIYGGNCIIKGNYFHGMINSATCSLGEWDGGANNVYENNVVDTGGCYEAVAILGDQNSLIDHNTFITPASGCFANPQSECASVTTGYKLNEGPGFGTVYRDNVMAGINNGSNGGIATYSENHNLCLNGCGSGTGDITGAPTLMGGSQPTTWDGFHLAAGSLGKAGASDGTDIGILANPS